MKNQEIFNEIIGLIENCNINPIDKLTSLNDGDKVIIFTEWELYQLINWIKILRDNETTTQTN